MNLWIEGNAIPSQNFADIQKWVPKRPDLADVLAFLKFWHSDQKIWEVKTSGSTGIPKVISISRDQMLASARRTLEFFHPDAEKDGWLLCISTLFVGGFMVLVRAEMAGMDVWIEHPRTNILEGLSPFPLQKTWIVTLAPVQLSFLASQPEMIAQSRFWKSILVGGGSLTPHQIREAGRFQCPVFHSYGMTETVSHIALARVNGPQTLPPGEFQVLPGVEVKANGQDCLEIRADVTNGNWLATRDRVQILENGRIRILGRLDRVINSGGLKLDPDWLKSLLLHQNPGLSDRFEILSIPDKKWGEMVVLAFHSLQPGLPETDWLALFSNLSGVFDPRLMPKKVVPLNGIPLLPGLKTNFPELVRLVKERLEKS